MGTRRRSTCHSPLAACMRYKVPQPHSSVHAAASSNARTPHPTCAATAGFAALSGELSVNMRTMRVYLVGGAVRDRLLGVPVRERDWVVVGAQPQERSEDTRLNSSHVEIS